MRALSFGGRWYNLCVADFAAAFMLHDAVRFKDESPASFLRMLTTIYSLIGHTVHRLRVDNDKVFLGTAF
jgi:hypothetical protein